MLTGGLALGASELGSQGFDLGLVVREAVGHLLPGDTA
jgi:hypothetical protein